MVFSAVRFIVDASPTTCSTLLFWPLDDNLLKKEEKEILEDLIIAAINDAKQKGETAAQEEMKSLTGGLPLPPGMKLPF